MDRTRQTPPPNHDTAAPSETGPPTWHSSELLGGAREVLIQHGEDVYRLKLTGNNKLILTK